MSPPAPDLDPKVTENIGVAIAVLTVAWAALRWLLWPRIQSTVRVEVDAAVLPLLARELGPISSSLQRIAAALEHVRERQQLQAEEQASQGASIQILLGDRRHGPPDRRHDTE